MYPFDEINTIKDRLIGRRQTVAVAESVTSGHLQAALSLAENARQFFQGGLTAYNLGQKSRHLLVEPIDAQESNCVSDAVARQMALEVAQKFSATYGLSVTGYAAEVPERNIYRPFAYFSISAEGRTILTRRVEVPEAGAMDDQLGAARTVLKLPDAPADTIKALRIQLWFTRQVLEAFVQVTT
jgi:nicotinamide-nucleotide amidase